MTDTKELRCPGCNKLLKTVEIPTPLELLEEAEPHIITITCNKCNMPIEFKLD